MNTKNALRTRQSVLTKSALVFQLSRLGDILQGGANRPVLLADKAALWLITAGRVDIFSVHVELNGELTGRRYLFSAAVGQIICGAGLSTGEHPVALLATSSSDTTMRKLSLEQPLALAEQTPGESEQKTVPSLLGVWLGLLAQSINSGTTSPHPLTVPNLTATNGLAELRAAVTQCHRTLLDALETWQNRERESERARLQALADAEPKLIADSITVLASTLFGQEAPTSLLTDPQQPLYSACKRVWRAEGIEVGPLPSPGPHHGDRDPLLVLAYLARLRIRQVTLQGTWWNTDHGALVAYLKENGRPVALIPSSPRSYDLCDETRGTRERVTPAMAKALDPKAYFFYRRLPEKPLTPWDLLHFGLLGKRQDLATIAVLGLGSGALAMVLPLITGLLFDTIIPGAQRRQLIQMCLALVVVGLSAALFDLARSLTILRVEGKLNASLNAAIWDRLLGLPARFFRSYTAGDLTQRAFGIQTMCRELSAHTLGTVLAGFYGVCNAALMFAYDWQHAAIGVVLVLGAVLVTAASGAYQVRLQRPLVTMNAELGSLVLQLLIGIAKLRVTGAEIRAFAFWAKEFAQLRYLALRARAPLQVFNAVYPLLSLIVMYSVMGHSLAGRTTGSVLGFLAAFQGFLMMTTQACQAVLRLANLVPTYDRIRPLLTAAPEVAQKKGYPGVLKGEIELAHVSFRYHEGGPVILDDLSLRIEPGEFVAITGPSGSGKSTLLRLLLRFEQPSSGAIYYDRQDLSSLDTGEVRRQLGVVLQDGKLMAGSIFDNIVGSANLTAADAMEAARLASFDRDLERFPMGLHTPLEQGGGSLSGGQRQRLLIARAVVRRPRILFFDEATSAIDNQTQAAVTASIDRLAATRVVIAHRLSTIVKADRIIVLQAGRIVQSGTYEELIHQPGPFADLARRQMADEAPLAAGPAESLAAPPAKPVGH